MILLSGKEPSNIENYICVDSSVSLILNCAGFIPIYRDVIEDKIYYVKCKDLEKMIKEVLK